MASFSDTSLHQIQSSNASGRGSFAKGVTLRHLLDNNAVPVTTRAPLTTLEQHDFQRLGLVPFQEQRRPQ